MTVPKVLEEIVALRRKRIETYGHGMNCQIPEDRVECPPPQGVKAFTRKPFIICEIKRKSPSRGDISAGLDPVAQAGIYRSAGIHSISVLTEQDRFGGSLEDLMAVKTAYPEASVLRKDFLLDPEDIEISYRAGADAVLLIAAILSPARLAELYWLASAYDMACLVEVHNQEELAIVRSAGIEPEILGINARNLNSFQVDLLAPLRLAGEVSDKSELVFESGIFAKEQLSLASAYGFTGALVGEAVVRDPTLVSGLAEGLSGPEGFPAAGAHFWKRIIDLLEKRSKAETAAGDGAAVKPIVKICGLANEHDARYAAELGADMLGFVFADSPRKADIELLIAVKDLPQLKVAVVTERPGEDIIRAWNQGLIDVFQYHGNESADECLKRGLPFYKALRLKDKSVLAQIMDYPVPRVLVDAWSQTAAGGTGKMIDPELARGAARSKPLWLAGGLNDDNIGSIISEHHPELIDTSSGLEIEPGKKDFVKMKRYFEEIERVCIQ